MRAMRKLGRGFTLMELMVVLVLAAVILAIGAPNFSEFRRNNRMTSVANEFLGAIQAARSEAIKRQISASVCPSDNPEDEDATCTNGPFRGWIAFVDEDGNCLRDTSNPDELVVRTGHRIDVEASHPLTPVSTGNCVSFAASGFLQTVATRDTATHTLFCDERGNKGLGSSNLSAARGLAITPTGRAWITRDVAEIDSWPVDCPSSSS